MASPLDRGGRVKKIIICLVLFLVVFVSGLLARSEIYFDEQDQNKFYQVTTKTIVDTITWKIVKDFDFEVGRDSYRSAITNPDSVIVVSGRKELINFIPPMVTETKLKIVASKGIVFVRETEPVKRKAWKIVIYSLFAVFFVPLFFLVCKINKSSIGGIIVSGVILLALIMGGMSILVFVPEYNNSLFTISLIVLVILSIPGGRYLIKVIFKNKK